MQKANERKLNQPHGMFPKLETLGTTGTYQVHQGVPDKQCFQCFHCSRQRSLLSDMETLDCTPSYAQAVRLHKEHSAGQLHEDRIGELLSEPKPNQKETLKLPLERLRQFAPRATDRQLEEFVFRACEYYQRYLKRQHDLDSR